MRKDDQIHSFNSTEYSEGNFSGLTKHEHMVIEFTKALVGSESFIKQHIDDNGVYSDTFKGIVKNGIFLADEVIKQLNK